jgi:hypothetical protein
MSNDRTYNGWSTYETWLVNLWLTNDRDLYAALHDDVVSADTLFDAKETLMAWMDAAYDTFLEAAGAAHGGLFPDLLKGALNEVNWYEIAKNWRDEE